MISFIQGLVMSRSLRISPQYIERVKRAVKHNGFFRQRDLAEELQLALSTVSSFLNGRRVDYATFYEICERLGLELKEIADLEDERSDRTFSAEALELATVDCSGEETGTAVSEYMERPPIESRCNETILQPGSLLRIKAPKRMGKTWLIDRILAQATKQKYRTVNLSLLLADGSVLSSLDKFLRWFCGVVGRELRLRDQLTDYWVDELGSSQSCTIYFEEYLLSQLEHPLVLALDDVDRIFPYSAIAGNFLAMLRAWYEKGKRSKLWKKLRLVVAHSTEVYIELNIHQSPFNVGESIELPEFNREQVQDLAQRQGLDWQGAQVDQLMSLVGGHPYLVQRAIYHLTRSEITLKELLQKACTEAGIYANHLRGHLGNLQEHPELAMAMKIVVESTHPVQLESMLAFQLQSLGLVQLEGNEVKARYHLYSNYLHDRLGN
ncbi:hypothetical protein MC7420_2838 [Coleofasciculus chthonoplastes PCC 7420]|uniref:HTH cro/C1-type domain-containing protein n=1 Tax=Coleofasciculus chthonoplastes PCC 7420 TaxID=118168 RepID=B4VKH7_9CYAN|nr:AAA-like domain-containing protein [Coleofasciculus chthonoplastes]EDX77514.1 hypothetical protein MC7420_2838 [Coleofasciculus chthonoplastes PCC 7420]